jgi:hypothetical protein
MNRIIFWIFFVICIVISSVFLRIITLEKWNNDCMISYVLSDKKSWYIYKLDSFKYHIDTENYSSLEQIWVSNGCLMTTYDSKFSFIALTNSVYCGIVTMIV